MSKPTVAEDLADLISTTFVSLEYTEKGNPYVEIDGDKIAERIADEIRAAEQAAREPLEAEVARLNEWIDLLRQQAETTYLARRDERERVKRLAVAIVGQRIGYEKAERVIDAIRALGEGEGE